MSKEYNKNSNKKQRKNNYYVSSFLEDDELERPHYSRKKKQKEKIELPVEFDESFMEKELHRKKREIMQQKKNKRSYKEDRWN